MKSTLITYPNIQNCRDLSSIVNRDGFSIRKNMLIRSAYLVNATKEELQDLYDNHNLRKVFDLRSFAEKKEKPETLIEGIEYRNHYVQNESIVGVDQDEEAVEKRKAYFDELFKRVANDIEAGMENMRDFYRTLASQDYSQQQYGAFLKEVLSTEGAVLWHCSLGKDRCGIATALVLEILDVPKETIFEDYMYTNICLHGDDKIKNGMDTFLYTDVSFLETYYRVIEEQYGSITLFLNHLGIDEKFKEAFKKKYLVKGDE